MLLNDSVYKLVEIVSPWFMTYQNKHQVVVVESCQHNILADRPLTFVWVEGSYLQTKYRRIEWPWWRMAQFNEALFQEIYLNKTVGLVDQSTGWSMSNIELIWRFSCHLTLA